MHFVFLDTETTGTNETVPNIQGQMVAKDGGIPHRIKQLAFIEQDAKSGEIINVFDELCKPPRPISIGAMTVTHITEEMVADAPVFSVLKGAQRFNEINNSDNVIIAHNLNFDQEMIEREGITINMRRIDTMRVLLATHPDLESFAQQFYRYQKKLYLKEEAAVAEIGKEIKAHDALGDVIVLKLLFEDLLSQGITVERMIEITNNPIVLKRWRYGKYKGEIITDTLKSDLNYICYMLNLQVEDGKQNPDVDLIHTLNKHLAEPGVFADVKLGFGKYKGLFVHDIVEQDSEYLEWCVDNIPNLKAEVKCAIDFYSQTNTENLHAPVPEDEEDLGELPF